ncbi:molybdopterin-dependent oxidoreductase [Streptomyces boluensis]|uniref:Molybdopterin-dependent oxidoreductase n=1 Tax=Streptomyces boluensis TaxID=1775135 RepID=A0A964UKK7_9ACTN|nr:molybdopterin-dependent oxidoreductase [Streptomyces boluensis]NBE50924.1 molybdopterin-dependent oxidoreductase [Streptomyces boluensis]
MSRLVVVGAVDRQVRLSVADLRDRWASRQAEVTFVCASSGARRHTFRGPLLREVVAAAGPGFDPARRRDRSRFLLEVTGGDGHGTVLSWAEIDEDFGNAPVLLATELDGARLDDSGSQLVVPTDTCGARYISGITRIRVRAGLGRDDEEPDDMGSDGTGRDDLDPVYLDPDDAGPARASTR